jgi:RNA polymerase sigma-70 factor (ECF subfamily)
MSLFEINPVARSNPPSVDHSPSSPPDPDERPSFGTIYRRHSKKVRASVRWFGVPARDVEDVTQNVFLAVYNALPRFDWSRRMKPWLNTIAYRTARDYLNARKNRSERLSDSEEFNPSDPASEDREGRVVGRRDARNELNAILQSLDENDRELLLLSDLDELPVREIAEAQGLPEGTVATRVRRARQRFEEAFQRRRAADKRRPGGAPMLPVFLMDPSALWHAARALPDLSLAAQARIWGRVVHATARSRAARALSSLVGLAPAKLVAGAVLATMLGALGGGAAVYAALPRARQRDTAPTPSESAALAAIETVVASPVIPSAPAPLVMSATAATARASAGSDARPPRDPAAAMLTDRAEMALLASARGALRDHQPERALVDLDRHAREFPQGAYKAERESLRREAARALGNPN